jgi:hypothetical protein
MKITVLLLTLTSLCPLFQKLAAQNIPTTTEERPETTDQASRQLIENYLVVTGGKQAHTKLRNVVATGTIKEAKLTRRFELVETQDGKRKVTYFWRLLGREYEEVFAYDGSRTWTQKIAPTKTPAVAYSGQSAVHFKSHRWLIQPMIVPMKAVYEFEYEGDGRVSGRPAYIVVGYGKGNERGWFYFDKEKFLLTRWGGIGTIANMNEYMDYRATQFASINGVLMPKQIELLAEGSPFGSIVFDEIKANQEINGELFYAPLRAEPVLRQRSVQP